MPLETRRTCSPTTLLESENSFHPPPPPAILSRPVGEPNQRSPSPSTLIENFDKEIPLVPHSSSGMSDSDEDDSRYQPGPLLPEFDNDPLPSDSDEGNPPSDSDDDPLPSDFYGRNSPSGDDGRNPRGDDGGNPPSSDEEEDPCVVRADMKRNLEFIQMIEDAILESQFGPGELEVFRNPQEIMFSPSDNPDLLLSISNFVANINGSQDIYTKNHLNFQRRSPEVKILSYDQVKRRVSNLSGVLTWQHYMCVDSCAGFTGPYKNLEECPKCHKPRYDPHKLEKSGGKTKVPQKLFTMFPVGPQLQSRWRSPDMAQKMHYRRKKTEDILRDRNQDADYHWGQRGCYPAGKLRVF